MKAPLVLSLLVLSVFLLAAMASVRREWPELVGATVRAAEQRIKQDMPGVHFQTVKPCQSVTQEYDRARVRLYVDEAEEIVVKTPMAG
ncbi:hypothetical protein KSP40_PGU008406 [Platanthera guangdongensis]|uniref:Uncharacterized protein n=1 Tax=Platanthera guangdongensis TaxID=2320717 RepID=A0ABR2LQ41_9ASPA